MKRAWELIRNWLRRLFEWVGKRPAPTPTPRMVPWRRSFGPWPKGGIRHPAGARNRHQRRADYKLGTTREQRVQMIKWKQWLNVMRSPK